MKKLSVNEAAEILGVSKEAIYNRIRRNTLNSVMEDGKKYVIISENEELAAQNVKPQPQPRTRRIQSDDRYEKYLLEQIGELKEHVKKLENDKEKLVKEKEVVLVDTRKDVERIYQERDKQLKQILALVARPLLSIVKKNSAIDAQFDELSPYERGLLVEPKTDKWVDLQEYMNEKGYSYKKKKSLNEQILSQVDKNANIKEEGGFLYIKRGKKIKQILKGKK